MTDNEESLRSDQLDAVARAGADRDLAASYLRDVATEEVARWRPEDVAGAVLSHRDLARHRTPGQARIRVFTPTVEVDSWATGNSVIEIVTEDMPFLVDSVVGALDRAGIRVLAIVHPLLFVRRDEDGGLLDVFEEAETAEGAGVVHESWMHIEIPRIADAEARGRIEQQLAAILEDVRAAVEDWDAMTGTAAKLVDGIEENPPAGLPAEEVEHAVDLLRWFADGHFTFLGYRYYELEGTADAAAADAEEVLRPHEGGLGLLRDEAGDSDAAPRGRRLAGAAARKARERTLLVITKANSRSTVHRQAYLDYVGVKQFDAEGNVVGEHRFLGLLTVSAYMSSVRGVPYIRDKVQAVVAQSGFTPESHLAKDLLGVLEAYPRDELFQADVADLARTATATVRLRERPATRLFLRPDVYGRFMSCLVYLPRDRYTTPVRRRIQDLLLEAIGGTDIEYTTQVSDGPLARLHMVVRVPAGKRLPHVDEAELERRIAGAVRTWEEGLERALVADVGEDATARLTARYGEGLPEAYKESVSPRVAVGDLLLAERVRPDGHIHLTVSHVPGAQGAERRLKLASSARLSLSRMMPVLTNLGVEVTDESTYMLRRANDGEEEVIHLYDVGVRADSEDLWRGRPDEGRGPEEAIADFAEAFAAAWDGTRESDGLEHLVLGADMLPREVTVLRALAAYVRQTSLRFTRDSVEEALLANSEIARSLVELFEVRFDPDRFEEPDGAAGEERRAAQGELEERITAALDEVPSLDHDRVLRAIRDVVLATDRTSAYRDLPATEEGRERITVTLKIRPERVPHLEPPRAYVETWVHGPRVEGVHLRYASIARGGLRWSDRRDDFRLEVGGLAKAQMLKNAVIVPSGAKGGFFAKHLPDPAEDRDAWFAEGQGAYREFIAGLLDVTDNLEGGRAVPPERVVRWDEEDTYLVVAADKGTATFSDLANAISSERGFWLDDAFASGGSAGYSHKGMGITARGAWESVKRHFREVGTDVQSEDFTVVGIGDMSGDVFGNGMLCSQHIRLVGAFDHRHVFLDPDPDAATSYAERKRLFDKPRSTWGDYDPALLSEGGGVYPRTAKSVPISPQVRERLGLPEDVTELAPNDVVRAILQAPVDLLWNGGIGTYVKASTETHQDAADRAGDAIRIDAPQLRVRVVGEGGNLGLTQRGRVEAALGGVKLNTDAIDNSAGVATSDVEVNLKILLGQLERAGDLTRKQRDEILAGMTDDVAAAVLRINYEQNVLLGNARMQHHQMVGPHTRLMAWLEEHGAIDRQVDALPGDDELAERAEATEHGLTSPEFAVLVAATKNTLKSELDGSALPEDPWLERELREYFPEAVRERFADAIAEHPLRRQIIAMAVANSLVNRGGISFVHRALEETGASIERIARAFVIVREIFGLREFVTAVEELDNHVSTDVQGSLYLTFRRLLDRAVRWFVTDRPDPLDIGAEIEAFAPAVRVVRDGLDELLRGEEAEHFAQRRAALEEEGVPAELARTAAGLLELFSALDIAELADDTGADLADVAAVYHAVSDVVGINRLLAAASTLPRETEWDAMARAALRDDIYLVTEQITRGVFEDPAGEETGGEPEARVRAWAEHNADALARAHASIDEATGPAAPGGLAPLSVVLRSLRSLARSVTVTAARRQG